MVFGQQSLIFPFSLFRRKKTPNISPRIQLLWDLVGYSWFLTLYEDLSLKSRFPVSPGHAGLHREAGSPPPSAGVRIPHALCSLLSPQKFRDNLTSTRLWLIWLPVVHKKWSSLSVLAWLTLLEMFSSLQSLVFGAVTGSVQVFFLF